LNEQDRELGEYAGILSAIEETAEGDAAFKGYGTARR
jgi:hypothetical protein